MQKLLIDNEVPGTERNRQLINVQFDCKRIKSYINPNKMKKISISGKQRFILNHSNRNLKHLTQLS